MGQKQRRVYRLDEGGNRIRDSNGKLLFDAVPTTDWGDPSTLEAWRAAWAAMVNAKFAEKGLACRVDHRSNVRRGLKELPTVHEGIAVRQMEAKGFTTNKGELNRWIKLTNALLRDIKEKIAALSDWLTAVREELSKPQAPTLADLLSAYYAARNAGAWSSKAKLRNLKDFAEAINYLTENQLAALEDLESHLAAHSHRTESVHSSLKAKSARKEELEARLRYVDLYQEMKPVHDELNAIKWKGKRKKFQEAHGRNLDIFYMARRKLEQYRTPAGKIPAQAWRRELGQIQQEYKAESEQYKSMWDDLQKLLKVKNCVDTALRQQKKVHERRRDMER